MNGSERKMNIQTIKRTWVAENHLSHILPGWLKTIWVWIASLSVFTSDEVMFAICHSTFEYDASKTSIYGDWSRFMIFRDHHGRLRRCWWQHYAGNFMMVTIERCWWQNHYDGDFFHEHLKSVTVILKLSPTHFVSNIHHQHRCSLGPRPSGPEARGRLLEILKSFILLTKVLIFGSEIWNK